MDLYIEIPLNYVLISIFLGYMYFYLYPLNYRDIVSKKSIIIGFISGFILSSIAVLVGLVTTSAFSLEMFVETSIIIGIQAGIVSIVLFMLGGICALTIKGLFERIKK
jgi:hypothetical protein